jgi:predicted Zn-dependent peptidase
MPGRRRSVLLVYLKTGSRFENPSQNGLSHFVEHMLFRGTEAHPTAHLLATAFEELGGTLDATTAADHGTLGISVPTENLSAVIPLVAEVFQAPLFTQLEVERGIIREEVLEYLSESGEVIDPAGLARELAFGNSGLGRPITGSLTNVEGFTEAALRAHHARTYIANDTIVSVAGPVDPDSVSAQIAQAFSRIPQGSSLVAEAAPAQKNPQFLNVTHPGSSQTAISLSFRCPSQTDSMEPALDMLLRVIDDGMATRLYHRLCDSRGLCYSVSGSYEAYEDTGLVEFEADTAHERAHEVLSQMFELTSELTTSLITPAEFERTQKRARWQYDALADEAGETADFLAMSELTKTARTPQDRIDQLLAVSREDIRDAAAQIFQPSGRNVVLVGRQSRSALASLKRLALG